ncbi:MAG: PEP-CTERM sorting domain-containing protein, partial [Cyanobacteria bacterium J06642_3]
MNKLKSFIKPLFASIFWSWNVCFLFIVYFGMLPFIGIPLILATFDGFVSYDFCLTFFVLVAVPTVSVIIGAKHLRNQPKNLIRWFYGVEAPLFVWCLVRLFVIRELTAASGLILGSLLVCIAAYAV